MSSVLGRVVRSTTFGAIVSCLLWSAAFVFIKKGVVYVPPLQFAGMRFLLAGLILFPLLRYFSGLERWKAVWGVAWANRRLLVVLGLFQIGFQYALFYSGLARIPAALGALLQGAGPLIVALLAHFMAHDDRLTGRKVAALLLGFIGVVVLTLGRQSLGAVGGHSLLGVCLLLASSVVAGVGTIWVSWVSRRVPPIVISSSSMVSGGLGLLLVGWGVEGVHALPVAAEFYVSLGALCVISAGALTIWYALLRRAEVRVSMLNSWKFIIPLSGAVLAWLVMPDEHPTVVALAGMLLVVSALVLLYWPWRIGG